MNVYSRPVNVLVIALMTGIFTGVRFPGYAVWTYPVIFSCAGIIIFAIIREKSAAFSPLILFFFLGYLAIQHWTSPTFPPNHIVNFIDDHKRIIVGTITDLIERECKKLIKCNIRVETIGNINVTGMISLNISLNNTLEKKEFSAGDRIRFVSRIKPIRNFNNPGGFDYETSMAFKDIRGLASVSEENIHIITKNKTQNIRERITDFIDKNSAGEEKEILKALIVGKTSGISYQTRQIFAKAGIAHLLAISGLHIGLVAGFSLFVFRFIFGRFRIFLWNNWRDKASAFSCFIPVIGYGLLAGMSPPAQRSIIMILVIFLTFFISAEYDPLNTLGVAAMLILIIYPPSMFLISFQLSFISVFSIIYGFSKMKEIMKKMMNNESRMMKNKLSSFIIKKIYLMMLISFFAILGTAPFIAFYFNQVSIIGFFANIVFIPLIGFGVLIPALLSAFLSLFYIGAAKFFINISEFLLYISLKMIPWFSNLSFSAFITPTPTWIEICFYYIGLWAAFNIIISIFNSKMSDSSFLRFGIVMIVVLIFFITDGFYRIYQRFWHDDLKITMIDVGQGSASLVEFPGGHRLLIDGGGFYDNCIFDIGKWVVAPFLLYKGIRTIDTVALSHPNTDHYNGLVYIAENFNVKRFWFNNERLNNDSFITLMQTIEKKAIHTPAFEEIFGAHNIGRAKIEIIYPPIDFMKRMEYDLWRDRNNSSMVVRIEFGAVSFLFTGDIEAEAEKDIIKIAGNKLKSTVLIAPHHGSNSSSTEEFINCVKPEYVIISAGWNNIFDFPHDSVIKRYSQHGCRIFRTDINGAVTISTNGVNIKCTSFQR